MNIRQRIRLGRLSRPELGRCLLSDTKLLTSYFIEGEDDDEQESTLTRPASTLSRRTGGGQAEGLRLSGKEIWNRSRPALLRGRQLVENDPVAGDRELHCAAHGILEILQVLLAP